MERRLKAILDVLSGRKPHRRPLWIMRQAGRYLPEYRALRTKAGSFLDLCYSPSMAAEATLQPLRRFDFDAAILFSDILVVPHAMGLSLIFKEGEGPVLETVSDLAGVQRLADGSESEKFSRVYETVGLVKKDLSAHQTLIGFSGAPWTVASYMIEGGSSKRKTALAVAIENPDWFSLMMKKLVTSSTTYLLGQIAAGAEVVQIFDSWAGDVPPAHLDRLVVRPIAEIIRGVRALHLNFPVIVFARGVGSEHARIALGTNGNCVGLEEGADIGSVLASLPAGVAVQGNLPNELFLGSEDAMIHRIRDILTAVPRERHIFNLGHGILPETQIGMVERLVKEVRAFG